MAQEPREKAINLKRFCLLPSEGWEKVPDRADEGLFDPSDSIEN